MPDTTPYSPIFESIFLSRYSHRTTEVAFDDADIPTIMRQISRWYDVDVEYDGKRKGPEDHFTGTFPRNTSLAGVLQILHTSGVRLVAEDKKIVIKS